MKIELANSDEDQVIEVLDKDQVRMTTIAAVKELASEVVFADHSVEGSKEQVRIKMTSELVKMALDGMDPEDIERILSFFVDIITDGSDIDDGWQGLDRDEKIKALDRRMTLFSVVVAFANIWVNYAGINATQKTAPTDGDDHEDTD